MLSSGAVSSSSGVTPLFPAPAADAVIPPSQVPAALPTANAHLRTALGDRHNWKVLGQQLAAMATRLGPAATPQAVQAALRQTRMDLHPDSSSLAQLGAAPTLEAFIQANGLRLPARFFHLTSLADAVSERALAHPLGNFGGGLSWPVALTSDAQRMLLRAATDYVARHPNNPQAGPSAGVLEYLNGNRPLPSDAADDPAKALQMLVGSARGQALGQAMQQQLNGIATDTSVNDYTLAAINVVLDPQSVAAPRRNTVAGFDLAQPRYWGRPITEIRAGLKQHLVDSGQTSAGMANVGAYALLARTAPQLLVKDLPDNVTFGSPAWVSLSIAAAAIEAQAPGSVPNMTFAQVMLQAKRAAMADPLVTQHAQRAALLDWGVVNGVVSAKPDDRYTPAEIERVRTAFNRQMDERVQASSLMETELPNRKEIALAKLKERFGEGLPFEAKRLSVKDPRPGFDQPLYDPNRAPAGLHSMLDIAMGGLHNYAWETRDPRLSKAIKGKSLKLDAHGVFNNQLNQAIAARKQGIGTTIKHLVAQLPLADRQNLEYGKLEFFQNHTYALGLGLTGRTLEHKNPTLLIKATRPHGVSVYALDLKQGAIRTMPASVLTREREREANRVFPIEPFTPRHNSGAAPNRVEQAVPSSFESARTQFIADAFVEHLDIDNDEAVKQAKGVTTYDRQMGNEWKLADFFLNLVPLRSAIGNFKQGNYLDGALDLGMDVFGFVTAGAGASTRLAKVGATAASAGVKVLKVARIIGTTAIGAFNPASGLGDLIGQGAGLIRRGGSYLLGKALSGVNQLKGAAGSYDLLKTVSKQYDAAATGTFKVAGQAVEGGAVLNNGRWYAFDVDHLRPYGPPLEEFTAQTKAVGGALTSVRRDPGSELSNRLLKQYSVPESRIAGLTRNSRGVYTGADGHLSFIRQTDSTGATAVYEVRQVTRTQDGAVQARIYHNNRQTPVMVQHVEGDQWLRLGARGGNPPTVAEDLGPIIGAGGEGTIYESLDGKSVYKEFVDPVRGYIPSYVQIETDCLNTYYGAGFATAIIEGEQAYIKMGKLDGVALSTVGGRSLPPQASTLLEDALRRMEEKGIYHQDLQLKNFLYSARDKVVYPVDIQSMPAEFVVGPVLDAYNDMKSTLLWQFSGLVGS